MTRPSTWISGLLFAFAAVAGPAQHSLADGPGGKGGPGGSAVPPERRVPSFEVGEELQYKARVWKGVSWLGMDVGDATFRTHKETYEGRPAYRFDARAEGGGFGYDVTTVIESFISAEDGMPLRYSYSQAGSETQSKRLEFEPSSGKIDYWRFNHCWDGNCGIAAHYHDGVHCGKRKCEDESHRVWQRRFEHANQPQTYDMLSAVYLARTLDLGAGPQTLRIVDNDTVYDVDVKVVKEEKIKTDAGKFRTQCIVLEPRLVSAGADAKQKNEKFRGLFGMSGSIRIWIDKDSRAPVRISGTIPFGVDLNGQVDLVKRIPGKR
jgi:hypothetical protein